MMRKETVLVDITAPVLTGDVRALTCCSPRTVPMEWEGLGPAPPGKPLPSV